MHGSGATYLHPDALAARADLTLGDTLVRPPSREIAGPLRSVVVEPRVMLLLLALADSPDTVVTRRQIELLCWGGIVRDDSINGAVAAVRKALRAVGSGLGLETIPRTGYRLRVPAAGAQVDSAAVAAGPVLAAPAPAGRAVGRRAVLAGTAAAIAVGAGWHFWPRPDPDDVPGLAPRLLAIEQAWRAGMPDSDSQALGLAREAVTVAPGSPTAWGWKALLERNAFEAAPPDRAAGLLVQTQDSVAQAISLDPGEANARTALATLEPLFGHWLSVRAGLQKVLADHPENAPTLDQSGLVDMSMGLVESAAWVGEQLVRADPLAPVHQHKHVYRLWATGRLAEMDRAADRALALWPLHPAVFLARMWTLAFTDRVPAARALLAEPTSSKVVHPQMIDLFDLSFAAMVEPASRQRAIDANLGLARRGYGAAIPAVNHLVALQALDEAFAVTEGFYLARGPLAPPPRSSEGLVANEMHGRKTVMLFLPVAAPLRADPRFGRLMAEIGLAEAWAKGGFTPDYLNA